MYNTYECWYFVISLRSCRIRPIYFHPIYLCVTHFFLTVHFPTSHSDQLISGTGSHCGASLMGHSLTVGRDAVMAEGNTACPSSSSLLIGFLSCWLHQSIYLIAGRMGLSKGKQHPSLPARPLCQVALIPCLAPQSKTSRLFPPLSLCHFSPPPLAWLCWWPQSKDNYLGENRRQLSPINARLTTPEWRRPPFIPAVKKQTLRERQRKWQREKNKVMRGMRAWNLYLQCLSVLKLRWNTKRS